MNLSDNQKHIITLLLMRESNRLVKLTQKQALANKEKLAMKNLEKALEINAIVKIIEENT